VSGTSGSVGTPPLILCTTRMQDRRFREDLLPIVKFGGGPSGPYPVSQWLILNSDLIVQTKQ
jgi:hypothetical protein